MAVHKQQPRKGRGQVPPDVPNIFSAASTNNVRELEEALPHYGVNATDKYGMTPLHHAAAYLAEDAINRLLNEPDIDPTITDKFGRHADWMPIEVMGVKLGSSISSKLAPFCHPEFEAEAAAFDDGPGPR